MKYFDPNLLGLILFTLWYSTTPVHYLDAPMELKQMYFEFKQEMKDFNMNNRLVSIQYAHEFPDMGMCAQDSRGRRKIVITPLYNLAGAAVLRAVLYHELAHCLLDMPHDEDSFLMQARLPNDNFFWTFFLPVAMLELQEKVRERRFIPLGG